MVRGEADGAWAIRIPKQLVITLSGLRFFMIHNLQALPETLPKGVDFVLFGHSHRYSQETRDGVTFLNPGSCGPSQGAECTMAMLDLDRDGIGLFRS